MTTASTTETWFDTYIDNYVSTSIPNWFIIYDYIFYRNTSYYWNIMLIPKANTSYFFGNNQVDTPHLADMDKWYMIYNCSTASPCKVFRFNSAGAYQTSASFTVNQNTEVTSGTQYTMLGSNLEMYTTVSWTDQYCDIQCSELTPIVPPSYFGIFNLGQMFPNYMPGGLVTGGENDVLINANWGMFNWLKEGLNVMFGWIVEGLSVVGESVAEAMAPLFTPSTTSMAEFDTAKTKLLNSVPYVASVNSFFSNLTTTGTTMPMITGTVLGSPISFDMKRDIFDPFLPVADTIKNIFKFAIWLFFVRRLWKESQGLINGAGSSMEA